MSDAANRGSSHRGRGNRRQQLQANENQQSRRPGITDEAADGLNHPTTSGSGRESIGNAGGETSSSRNSTNRDEASDERTSAPGRGRPRNFSQAPVTINQGFNKHGTAGQPITVRSNYFQLMRRPDMHLLQHHVTFTPEVENRGVQKALIRQHEEVLGQHLFDGTHLFTIRRLQSESVELVSTRHSDNSTFRITIRFIKEIQNNDPDYRTVVNIIFRQCLAMLKLVMIRRDYFDPEEQQDVREHNIKVWPGYRTTIDRYELDSLLNVEVIHKFLRSDTAENVMRRIYQNDSDDFRNRARAELVGKIVMTVYNYKTYRIDDIDFDQNVNSTFFEKRKDRHVSYLDFYRERYEKRIQNLTQPLLATRPSRRDVNRGDNELIYLIPELCLMTGLSDDQRKNFNVTRAVSQITHVSPDRRVQSLMRFRQRLANNARIQAVFNNWGLGLAPELVTCQARVLPTRNILIGQQQPVQVIDGDWSRHMQRARMSVPVKLENWIVVYPSNMDAQVRRFVNLIIQVGTQQSCPISQPTYVPLQRDRVNNYNETLEEKLNQREWNLAMCVLRTNHPVCYSTIKTITLCRHGVPSQVVTGRIIDGDSRRLMSIATKVMTQLACKLGAEPWQVQVPIKPWMIVGYDTYHDARQQRAVGAFVASTNQTYTRFYSSVKKHVANEEISPSFREHTLLCLRAYMNINKQLPDNIIVYRDGIGTGDIQNVLDIEVKGIQDACRLVDERRAPGGNRFTPGIAFIVVSKRINTRFFRKTTNSGIDNPPCGTVVDNTVTHDHRFDFFLISQKVTRATVSPTHFNVIYDTTGLGADAHQNMAYALTQLYYNWTGTLRVPAPVQYAHKLAYLVGEHLGTLQNDIPAENLSKFPYYL